MSEDNGKRIQSQYNNPIDNVVTKFVSKLAPYFKQMKYTVNGITTISLIFGIASLYHLARKELIPFTAYVILSYVFDVMGKYYAIEYNDTYMWDDQYSQFKSLIIVVSGIYVTGHNLANYPVLILCMLTLLVLTFLYVGCKEELNKDKSDTPGLISREMCEKNIGVLRWFGPGTTVSLLIALIWYLHSDGEDEMQMLNLGNSDLYNG